ncbi:MAG: hypothetical protein IT287_07820 [Bdellovibrionaceae bacterium]|nr:hypothetical protein [Pseudobdellovibrionaceae bacterium]
MNWKLLLSIVFIIWGSSSSQAANVEAVQLDYLSPDASLNCNRIFFTSSQHFKGVVYAVPIVVPEINENNEEVGSVVPNHNVAPGSDKIYLFKFNVFFPRDEVSLKDKLAPFDASRAQSCTFAAVKKSYNDTHPDSPIETITDMPLTSFEVSVPDYAAETILIGKDADVTTYADQSFTIALPITEKEKTSLFEALSNDQSVQAKVKMKFKGRSRDGSVKIDFSTEELAANFKFEAAGAKMMTRAKINAALKVAISKTQIKIQTQSSSEEFFQKAAEEVLSKVISQIDLQSKSLTEDAEVSDKQDEKSDSEEKISVEVVANLLSKVDNRNIQLDNTTAPEVATIDAMMSLKPRMEDPNIMLVRVAAGEEEGSLSAPVAKNETIRIIPAFSSLLRYGHKTYETYMNKEQLDEKRYSNFMSNLTTDEHFSIEDVNRNGNNVAIGTWDLWSPSYWFTEYVWKRVETWPELIGNNVIKANTNLEEFSRYPICVTFTNIGQQRKMIPLAKLIGDNAYFKGRYDEFTGEIVLTAKKDLGMMMFRSRFLLNDNNDANDLGLTGADRESLASCSGRVANAEASKAKLKEKNNLATFGPELRNVYHMDSWDYRKTSIDVETIVEIQRSWGSTTYKEEYVSLSCASLDPAIKENLELYPQCFDDNNKLLTCKSANVDILPDDMRGEYDACYDKNNELMGEKILPIDFPSQQEYVLADATPYRKEVIRRDRKAYLAKQVVYYSVSRPRVDAEELQNLSQPTLKPSVHEESQEPVEIPPPEDYGDVE